VGAVAADGSRDDLSREVQIASKKPKEIADC
jgi:hypothetical protein